VWVYGRGVGSVSVKPPIRKFFTVKINQIFEELNKFFFTRPSFPFDFISHIAFSSHIKHTPTPTISPSPPSPNLLSWLSYLSIYVVALNQTLTKFKGAAAANVWMWVWRMNLRKWTFTVAFQTSSSSSVQGQQTKCGWPGTVVRGSITTLLWNL